MSSLARFRDRLGPLFTVAAAVVVVLMWAVRALFQGSAMGTAEWIAACVTVPVAVALLGRYRLARWALLCALPVLWLGQGLFSLGLALGATLAWLLLNAEPVRTYFAAGEFAPFVQREGARARTSPGGLQPAPWESPPGERELVGAGVSREPPPAWWVNP